MAGKLFEASAVVFLLFASFAALSSLGVAAAPAQYHAPAEIYPQGSGSGLDADTLDAVHASALQARVSGTCSSGNAIRVINADGSVSCQSTSGGSGTVTSVGSGTGLSGGPITTSGTLSIANPSKACGAGSAIQSFDMSSGASPGCVSVGGGSGTVTSVGSGSGLTGGPITAAGTLSIANPVQSCGAGTAIQSLNLGGGAPSCVSVGGGGGGTVTSVSAGTGLSASPNPITGSGTISLNLGSANTWTATQTVTTSGESIVGNGGSTGVKGGSVSGNGIIGTSISGSGVWGASNTGSGIFGQSSGAAGVYGQSSGGNGVVGIDGGWGSGVYGQSANGNAIYGLVNNGMSGVVGNNLGSGTGVTGTSASGTGVSGSGSTGVYGTGSATGVRGFIPGNNGMLGTNWGGGNYGVYGASSVGGGWGIYCAAGKCGGSQAWSVSSDERLKNNITTIENALAKVEKLRGVNFEWKNTNKTDIGFIAQEVKDVVPEVVSQDSNNGYYAMETSQLTAVLVEAVKEQQKQISEQQKQLDAQQGEIEQLKEEITALKAR